MWPHAGPTSPCSQQGTTMGHSDNGHDASNAPRPLPEQPPMITSTCAYLTLQFKTKTRPTWFRNRGPEDGGGGGCINLGNTLRENNNYLYKLSYRDNSLGWYYESLSQEVVGSLYGLGFGWKDHWQPTTVVGLIWFGSLGLAERTTDFWLLLLDYKCVPWVSGSWITDRQSIQIV